MPESERSGVLNISSFGSQVQQEVTSHSLRFEAYELPKPLVPSTVAPLASSTELVPVPEPLYPRETQQAALVPSVVLDPGAGSSELKLRLDGVQKKWGRPNYSTSASSSSESTSQKTTNGVAQTNPITVSSKGRETYDSKKTITILV